MRRVVFNQKGGVGKSTITSNLAAISAHRGKRTLVIDLDPQTNTTHYLMGKGIDTHQDTLAGFFDQMLSSFKFGLKPLQNFIHKTPFPGLDILPSHRELESLQDKLGARYKIYKLSEALTEMSMRVKYDEILIDTAPAMNFYTRSAMIAARRVLVPFDCDDFSRRALYQLMEDIAEIREDHNRDLEIEGIVVNQFLPQANLPQRVVKELKDEGLPMLASCLSSTVKVRESHEQCQPMIHLFPNHKVTRQFEALWDELNGIKPAQQSTQVSANSQISDQPQAFETA